jgi:hypothetical protein
MKLRTIQMRVGFVLLAAALVIIGCAKEEELSIQNLPPETYLAIADSVRHVTTYTQTLRWWGEDKDGEVIAFEYRWFIDPQEGSCRLDTGWVRTEETSGDFNLPVSGADRTHRFEIRAIDNDEASDPSPCSLTLPVNNSRPGVVIWNVAELPDTTFPAFRARLHGTDPEGDNTIAKYIAWLDGDRQNAKILTPPDTTVSLGLGDFGGRYEVARTLNVIAVDSGCDTSAVAAYTWFVKQPTGRILVVDDLGKDAGAAEGLTDRFYRAGLDSCGEAYSVLDIEKFGGMLSAFNFTNLFSIFDLVVWYNEPNKTASPAPPAVAHISAAGKDLEAYVESGGRLLVSSLGALGSGGALTDSLWPEIFGVDSILVRNSSTNFDCKNWIIQSNLAPGPDSVRVAGSWPGVECMLPAPGATPLYYIRPGTAGAYQTENYYLGVLNSWRTGKAALLTFPLSRSNQYDNARTEYCRLVNLLLR